ncbi:TetR family transcriptional regulator [Mycobacterium intermedium]|uniref:TetR family transcriptional regulator n=1 Tax=Mycobacterium intermedium TaxID=28445 RepID=A0A1E3SC70_MYCIE|nr:TetR/AcrR family transcriptional regulator [Mycobacterium intermedium]MCV6966884.1 TetR/AcrR family transcriptional regulator [Mycobacterium intermedium]ODQ99671.1 TetR family transcriptional regulator [Mycobacterium intermedium]OPE49044.1 TetR family transcriptional regulator [Mycobacterium intermedium]ORB07177.1 TetR family transcriptional regulator [Mycobacterium intermedium]
MASPRRIGSPDAKTRQLLLDAAERLLLEDGYSAVTGRNVAKKAGLRSQLVPYHFGTMDGLFLEVLRRRADQGLELQRQALKTDKPLWALWRMGTDTRVIVFGIEFIALANRRKALKDELARYVELLRDEQIKALSGILEGYGIPPDEVPPEVVMTLMRSVTGVLAIEETLGVTLGHAKTVEFAERYIRQLEGDPPDAN